MRNKISSFFTNDKVMHISKSLLKEGAAYAGGRKPVLSTPIL